MINFSKYAWICLLVMLTIPGFAQEVRINEVMYSNPEILFDSDGDSPDWVEILNAGQVAVNLDGWSLADDTTGNGSWTFSSYLLEPGEYLLVFLSGKNRHWGGEFHTDFKIALGCEPVCLFYPGGGIADMHPVKCVPEGLTGGRQPDGSAGWLILDPSPGKSNNGSLIHHINVLGDSLRFSHPSGYYTEDFNLRIENIHPANKIYYTTDGSLPDESSNLYIGPFTPVTSCVGDDYISCIPTSDIWVEPGQRLNKHPVIRARALSDGCPASPTQTAIYFIGDPLPGDYNVPVVSVVTDPENLFDDDKGIYVSGNHNNYDQRGRQWERPVHFSMFDSAGSLVMDQDAGARIHGGGSRGNPQKSLRLYAREEYGKAEFTGTLFKDKPEVDTFYTLLLRSVRDWSNSLFKEELCHHLVRDMEIDYMAGQTVIVFINGEYWGIQSLRERQDGDYLRMNHQLSNPEVDIISHKLRVGLLVEEGNADAYHELLDILSTSDLSGEEGFALIDELIDINSITDYYIAELYFANGDFPQNNYKMWKEQSIAGKWKWLFYDCDACMFRTRYDHLSEYFSPSGFMTNHEEWALEIFRKVLQNELYRDHFVHRLLYHINHTFSPSTVISEINRFEEMYRPLIAEHIFRWKQPNEVIKWIHNVSMLRTFAMQRPPELLVHLQKNLGSLLSIWPNPSAGEIHIGHPFSGDLQVSIRSLSGTQLYTRHLAAWPEGESLAIQTGLTPGMYILTVADPSLSFSEKLIIE